MRGTWVAALAAAVTACGQGRTDAVAHQQVPPAQGGTASASGPPCGGLVTVRVDGVDPGQVTALQLAVTGVSFATDIGPGKAVGDPLAPERTASGTLDVAAACQELAVLKPPQGSGIVQGTVMLGTTHVCVAGSCFDEDACEFRPLRFQFDPAKVSPDRCEVVVRFDLARSAYTAGGAQAFLPNFSVHY
jgi:hypothetical protein